MPRPSPWICWCALPPLHQAIVISLSTESGSFSAGVIAAVAGADGHGGPPAAAGHPQPAGRGRSGRQLPDQPELLASPACRPRPRWPPAPDRQEFSAHGTAVAFTPVRGAELFRSTPGSLLSDSQHSDEGFVFQLSRDVLSGAGMQGSVHRMLCCMWQQAAPIASSPWQQPSIAKPHTHKSSRNLVFGQEGRFISNSFHLVRAWQ